MTPHFERRSVVETDLFAGSVESLVEGIAEDERLLARLANATGPDLDWLRSTLEAHLEKKRSLLAAVRERRGQRRYLNGLGKPPNA